MTKIPRITVRKNRHSDGRYPWVICVDGSPTYYRLHKETAMKHAAGIRKDIKRVMGKKS